MNTMFLYFLVLSCTLFCSQAFVSNKLFPVSALVQKQLTSSSMELLACRRNNKTEKRKRNRQYARKFAGAKGGPSRRSVVISEKRNVVAANEEKFVAQLFKFTTDEDMPVYTAFSFA